MSNTTDTSKPMTRRADIIMRIEQRLTGQLSDAAIATWAFDRFYAEELGSERYESGYETAIADALDALMFNDDPGFALRDDDLRALADGLQAL